MRNKILILLFASTCANFLDLVLPKTCPDDDIAAKCEGQCELAYIECTLDCSNTNCLIECGRVFNACSNDCPCNVNCPNGCNGCMNPICICGDNPSAQNEDNLQQCKMEKSNALGQCIIDCKNDQSCEQSCVTLFKEQYDQCPCQNDCPFGCPCDAFDCQPDKNSVLVLYNDDSERPVLIKFDGGVEENLDFTMGLNTSTYHSCSAKLNGELFVFGGRGSNEKQISKIVDCSLKRIGELPNAFNYGTCGTFLFDGDERVMFCFPGSGRNKCFSYNGELYTDHPNSASNHYGASLGDIENKILAVGYYYSSTKVELFDISSNKWSTKTSFPYCNSYITGYGVISRNSSVLIIGGQCDDSTSPLIAKYTIDKWERVGNLQNSRTGHRAIANEDRIYVVGGNGERKIEVWTLDENDGTINMKMAEPNLNYYSFYPELFFVESDFCIKK